MKRAFLLILAIALLTAVLTPVAHAYYVTPNWIPIYQGVDYYSGSSSGVTVYAVRVDLWNPNVSLYASHDNGGAAKEVTTEFGYQFNSAHGCVVSANASYCDVTATGDPAKNVDIWGLGICDGTVVSPGYYGGGGQYNCQMRFTSSKVASIVQTMDTPTGIHTAVTGNAYHLVNGQILGATSGTAARTSFGLSSDNRYLFMACVSSATIYNLSKWMYDLGAWNAINMDGGGSSCLTRADVGKVFPSGTERRVGVHLGVRSLPLINPPWLFNSDIQGFTRGNSCSDIWYVNTGWPSGWPGCMYFDQTGNDCNVFSPAMRLSGGTAPQCLNVSLYEQNGTTSAHDMQVFWKTDSYNYFDANKSSPIVNYTSYNNWTAVNLNLNNSYFKNQWINQMRLDFDQTNHSTRHIVNHIILQPQIWYTFDSSVENWAAGHSVATPFYYMGAMIVDQTGSDSYIIGPLIGGTYHYLGGANDRVHVRLSVTGGNTTNHDMQVFFITIDDTTWDAAKSSSVVYYSGNDQWKDIYIPVGQNSIWRQWAKVVALRLDFDNANNPGARYIIDYIKIEPGS